MDRETHNIPRFKNAIRALRHVADGMEELMDESIDNLTSRRIDILKCKIKELRDAAEFLENHAEE